METVEVVIMLPRSEYEELTRGGYTWWGRYGEYIKNGTVLPKGHGDLVDRDELLKDTCTAELWDGREEEVIWESTIKLAPTVIEADKEVKNE